jgi:SAM-dependent methyltransferase
MSDPSDSARDRLGAFKVQQKAGTESTSYAYEGNEHIDYFKRLPFERLAQLLRSAGVELDGSSLHVASCGSGIDIHYLAKHYRARVLATDYSEAAIARIRQTFPDIPAQVEDNERLSFPDGHFDWSFIAAALHHLPRPVVGLYELLRVSRRGVIAVEPNSSWLTRLAARWRVAQEYEATGNYVYRMTKDDVHRIARSGYCDYAVTRCFAPHRVAKTDYGFALLKGITRLCNAVASPLGNYIIFVIKKRPDSVI